MKYVIYLCFFFSGMTGLIYQIVWSKYFIVFIGATTYAHAITLFTFMGGLAFGNYLFGNLADHDLKRLKLYASLEAGIGAACLVFPDLFGWLSELYVEIAQGSIPDTPANLFLKLILCIMSILLPTTLMGGTLPVMSKYLVRNMKEVGSRVSFLYFFNTAGASIGCIAGGFFIIQKLGIDFSIQAVSLINILISGITFYLSRYEDKSMTDKPSEAEVSADRVYTDFQRKIVIITIAVSGFSSMLYELVWTRFLSLVVGSATQSFSIMLLTFITGIAIGSYIAGRLFRRDRDAFRLFAVIEILIFVSIIAVIPAYERLFYYFYRINTFLPRNEDFFFLYEMTQILICFLAILLPTVFIGMSLPVASRVNVKSMDHLGRGIGNIFSFNIMGNITGSLVTGFLLIPFIGLEKSLITGMALNFIAGAFVLIHAYPERKKMTYSVSLAGIILIACFFIFPLFNRTVLQSGMYRVRNIAAQSYEDFKNLFKPIKLLYYKDGSSSTVSVIEDKGFLFLKVGGKTDASNHHDMATQVMLGQIGLLLNADAKDVFVLGLGSGVTANSASTHENVRSVEVAEISPEVIEASEFFNTANEEISKNPKVKIINADGREYLRLNPEKKFDVIISEPSNPWMAGIGSLFTKEFFTEVSSHLNEKGLMVQWIHIYEMNDIIFSIILHTFGAVFPNVTVWSIHKYNDILLVGSNEPVMLNIEKFKGKFLDTKILKDLEKCKVAVDLTGPLSILSMQILSNFWFRYHFSSGNEGLINSDNFPVIEYEAPKAFFAGENAHFILEIDERKLSRSRSHLFLKKFLSENTFKPEDANNILSSFRQEMKVTNANLAKYMIEYLYDSSSVKSIVHYLRFLDTSILGNNILYSALISNPDFSTEDCISYLKFKEAYIENKKSIFYSPDLKEIEENYSKCLTKFPENKPEFKSSLISIYRSAGDLEKEKTVLLDLLGSDSISQDDRILLSKELAKVEFYSGNPAGSRKIFEGLKNDKEVSLYLDEISRIEKK